MLVERHQYERHKNVLVLLILIYFASLISDSTTLVSEWTFR